MIRTTESFDDAYRDLDARPDGEILDRLIGAQERALAAVRAALPEIEAAAGAVAGRMRANPEGRLIYCGAGTSARLGVQDGVELVPTYGWPHARLGWLVAGGLSALTRTAEGAEDDADQAAREVAEMAVGPGDAVIALSASGVTPYTLAACRAAREAGALTVGIANNPGSALAGAAEFPITADSGPEAIGGSTRMSAGTAQKVVLNLLSTLAMIRLGRVYGGLMVDVIASSDKLRERAVRIVTEAAGTDEATARAALAATGGAAKPAILVARGLDAAAAEQLLDAQGGDLRRALAALATQG